MPVSESDIELLESHLDGELSSLAEAALLRRLSGDHELKLELSALRADRAIRLEVFEACEPNDLAVRKLVLSVRKQVTKEAVHGDRMRIFRYVAATAACIMISFSAGWLGKGRVAEPGQVAAGSGQGASSMQEVARNDRPSGSIDFSGQDLRLMSSPGADLGTNLASTFGNGFGSSVSNNSGGEPLGRQLRDQGLGTLVSNDLTPRSANNSTGAFQVNLTDSFGHVVAVQHFNTLKEARDFTEDVGQWQKQQQMRGGVEPADYPVDHPVDSKGQF